MNYFQHQDAAKKKTTLLVLLMLVAVISLIVITAFLVGMLLYFFQSHATSIHAVQAYNTSFAGHFSQLIQSSTFAYIALGVIAVVLIGSLFKFLQLRQGGRYVAESLGGRLLNHHTQDHNERKILNVVEEMAIASGNPVPLVFLLEEDGINAFAAGLSRRDAVIGITRGCIRLLNRDELQGVIAHEFSHIHNGDMRLNIRLIAFLHGIIVIGLIGEMILRGSAFSSLSGNNRNNKRGQQAGIGLALMVIGYGGTFFGNIIKAAVSRQREFLADASAVQFTRNPEGIGGALKKIGGHSAGAMLSTGGASEFSHLYFGQGIPLKFNALMATHPSLEKRIQRIQPRWNGKFSITTANTSSVDSHSGSPINSSFNSPLSAAFSSGESTRHESATRETMINADEIIENVGEINDDSLDISQQAIHALPPVIADAVHNPFSARALIYCLLLDKKDSVRQQQIAILKDKAHPKTLLEMQNLYSIINQTQRHQHLILLDLCMPALKLLSDEQRLTFKKNLIGLIKKDSEVSLFEWCLYRITIHNIENKIYSSSKTLKQCEPSIEVVLSAIVYVGQNALPSQVFAVACDTLDMKRLTLLGGYSYKALDSALNELSQLKPLEKPRLLKAIMAIINADKHVTPAEAELFRAIADTLDCPVPPFYPSY